MQAQTVYLVCNPFKHLVEIQELGIHWKERRQRVAVVR